MSNLANQKMTDAQKIADAEKRIADAEQKILEQKARIRDIRNRIRAQEQKHAEEAGKNMLKAYQEIEAGVFDAAEAERVFGYLKSSGYFDKVPAEDAISEEDVDIPIDEEL